MHHAILTIKSLSNGKFGSTFKPVLFALLLWAASAAGEIPVPGTPVPITLQTFVECVDVFRHVVNIARFCGCTDTRFPQK